MQDQFGIAEMSCDYKITPIDVEGSPLLRWKLNGVQMQSAWRICARSNEADLWDSGWHEESRNFAEYAGMIPESGRRVCWTLEVRDSEGRRCTGTSEWKQGIHPQDWQGEWIGYDVGRADYDPKTPYYCADDFELGENHPFLPAPAYLRYAFKLNRFNIREATLYVSAFGYGRVKLNGEDVTDAHMLSGVCDYRKRVYYQAFDVRKHLRAGENAFGCILADGLYAGYIGLNPRQWWGAHPRLNLMLLVEYSDGSTQYITSNKEWKAAFGGYTYADVMHGSGFDANREPVGFDKIDYDDRAWAQVDTGAEYDFIPSANPGVPLVEHGRYPAQFERISADTWRVDCGRCFSGVLNIRLRGEKGARIDICHAEERDRESGELYLRGNRSAQAHDSYILSGSDEERFEPDFTYHGFRYADIVAQGRVEILSVEGVAISSETPQTAEFVSGNDVVNGVWRMIENTRQSNMFDYPTDVCARDERLGWGAEGHFFMYTASRSCMNARFLRKWMQDIADGQLESGSFWATAPAVMMRDIMPFAGDLQSDMGLHCCYLLLRLYEDYPTVRKFFPALERNFEFQKKNSDRLIRFAIARDWLDIASENHRSDFDHGYGHCPAGMLGTIYFARNAQLMADLAQALNLDERAEYYRGMSAEIRRMFHVFFSRRDKLLRDATQGAYLAAAAFDLLDEDEMLRAREWVRNDFAAHGATWGTATTPAALYGMMKLGLRDLASSFIRSDKYPSLGYMLGCGATAVWERWDAIYDGRFHPHAMNAFDHIGLATVGDWMVGALAGVSELAQGYAQVRLAPLIDARLGGLAFAFESVHGRIESKWKLCGDALEYNCVLPACVRGEIELPLQTGQKFEILQGKDSILAVKQDDNLLCLSAAEGSIILRISPWA